MLQYVSLWKYNENNKQGSKGGMKASELKEMAQEILNMNDNDFVNFRVWRNTKTNDKQPDTKLSIATPKPER